MSVDTVTMDEDAEDISALVARLSANPPAPSAALRRRIHEAILTQPPADELDPRRVRTLIAAYAGAGTLLLAAGALITFL